jgi:acyl-coenzyme A synthetase/AMP-(fatty) acid ligase
VTGWTITSPSALAATNLLITSPQHIKDAITNVRAPWPGRERRKVVVAGGRLPRDVRDVALKIACSAISLAYGATETGSIATGASHLLDRHPGAVGFAVTGAKVEIVDEKGEQKHAGQPGIVRTRASTMAHGYAGNIEAAEENPFRDGWFYPGDEGIMFEDGLLAITGRLSETLNLMGAKFSTEDFEAGFADLPHVQELAAVMVPSPKGEVLVIAVTCDDRVNAKTLWQQLRGRIPATVPFELVRLRTIPRNAMGKVDRPELRRELAQHL